MTVCQTVNLDWASGMVQAGKGFCYQACPPGERAASCFGSQLYRHSSVASVVSCVYCVTPPAFLCTPVSHCVTP